MAFEADILGRDEGCDERRHLFTVEGQQCCAVFGEQVGILDERAVLDEERTDHFTVFGVYFGSDIAFGVFELLERRQFSEHSQRGEYEQEEEQSEGEHGNDPQPFDYTRALEFLPEGICCFIHILCMGLYIRQKYNIPFKNRNMRSINWFHGN